MSDNNKKIILSLVILFMIVGVGWLFWSFWNGSNTNKTPSSSQTKQKQEEKKDDQDKNYSQQELKEKRMNDVKQYQKASTTKDSNLCQKIDNDYTRDQCYKNLAKQQLNSDICDSITSKSIKSSCLYFVYFNQALNHKDASLCKQLPIDSAAEQCSQRVKNRNSCETEECYNEYTQSQK